ncbi:MAG TPA: hypothetical protein VKT82_01720 [Ktedonobacterales bacterium]|nr:hypothetical protein [Ktedonobacterales bacterium]
MRLSINEDGNVQIDLEPDDEQVIVNIGPAQVLCFGGTIADPGTGPLVQVVVTDEIAQAVVEYHNACVGNSSLEVQFSPLAEGGAAPG